jgi:hypothetical protein
MVVWGCEPCELPVLTLERLGLIPSAARGITDAGEGRENAGRETAAGRREVKLEVAASMTGTRRLRRWYWKNWPWRASVTRDAKWFLNNRLSFTNGSGTLERRTVLIDLLLMDVDRAVLFHEGFEADQLFLRLSRLNEELGTCGRGSVTESKQGLPMPVWTGP